MLILHTNVKHQHAAVYSYVGQMVQTVECLSMILACGNLIGILYITVMVLHVAAASFEKWMLYFLSQWFLMMYQSELNFVSLPIPTIHTVGGLHIYKLRQMSVVFSVAARVQKHKEINLQSHKVLEQKENRRKRLNILLKYMLHHYKNMKRKGEREERVLLNIWFFFLMVKLNLRTGGYIFGGNGGTETSLAYFFY